MNEPPGGTHGQTPEDVRSILSRLRPAFGAGEAVPGLSSWLLERRLGGGGFGEVWLARHAWNVKEQPRAVKFCTDPEAKHRLVTHERNVVVRVMKHAGDHPNIVPLLDCNLDGEIPWLMYEFVEGGTLAALLPGWRELPLPKRLGKAVRTLHALAGALAACHRLDPPLVHRDMKPQNVLMAGSRPRITDFGIGGVVLRPQGDSTGSLTAYAAKVPSALRAAGTKGYAPREQQLGSPPDPRDDVHALGVIAYQLVHADLMVQPGVDAGLELRDQLIPGTLASLIVRSIAINPSRRPRDAAEWEAELAALVERAEKRPPADTSRGERTAPRPDPKPAEHPQPMDLPAEPTEPEPIPLPLPPEPPPPSPPRRWRWRPQNRRALLAGGALAFVLATAAAVALFGKRPERDPAAGGLAPGERCDVEIAPGVKMTFCWVPAGECQLGSPKEEQTYVASAFYSGARLPWLDAEGDARRGKLKTGGFWMGKYEVTQAEWTAVMGSNPSSFGGKHDNKAKGLDTSRFPVESGTWDMICGADGKGGFLAKINAHGGIPKALGKGGRFKLPTEDEWEYACRGGRGNARPFYWGNELNGMQANCKGTDLPYGTTAPGAFLDRPCSVEFTNDGKYPPHPWGLMHMHGNVCEWCDSQYEQIASRVVRGGSWAETAHHCASAARRYALPSTSSTAIGLRVMIALAN